MKKLFISFAIAVMAFVSCSKEALNESAIETKSYTLTAIAPGDDQTKTSLQKGEGTNWNVLWSENDALKVKISGDGTSSSHYANYTLESGAGTGNAVFRGTVEAPDEVFAFYPSSLVGTINSYGMFFNIPTEQTYSATEEVANNSLPMYAKGNKGHLTFQHACSVLRFPVWTESSGVKLSNLTVSSDKYLSGTWFFNTGFTTPARASNAAQYVSLDCGNTLVSTSDGTPTILNVIVGIDNNSCGNLKVSFTFSDGSLFNKETSTLSLAERGAERGKIYTFPITKITPIPSDFQIKIDGGDWEVWDGVSDFSTPTSFFGLRGTTSTLSVSMLEKICSKIKSGSEKIDLDLSGINVDGDLQSLPRSASLFEGNNKIKNVKLPNGLKEIKGLSFISSTAECLTIPESVESVGTYIFSGCANAYFDVVPTNPSLCAIGGALYKINDSEEPTYTLYQVSCSVQGSFTVADNTTAISNYGLALCKKITELTIPATVHSLGANSTWKMEALANIILLGETPPDVVLNSNPPCHWLTTNECAGWKVSGTKTITVPAGSLSTYTGTEGNRTVWWEQYHDVAGYTFTD